MWTAAAYGRPHLVKNFVHGVGADKQHFCPAPFQGLTRLGQDAAAFLPLPGLLAILNGLKIHTIEKTLGGMQSAEPLVYGPIDDLVIADRAFPAHASQQAYDLHNLHLLNRHVVKNPSRQGR